MKAKGQGLMAYAVGPVDAVFTTADKLIGSTPGDSAVTEDCAKRIFSLPMHPYLAPEDQAKITDIVACSPAR